MSELKAKPNNRETELDLLRILAILAVITVHAMNTDGVETSKFDSIFLTLIDCCITWEIPIFVMISGRFFLDPLRKVTGRKICNSIKRLVIAFVVWDIIYQIMYILNGTYDDLNWKGIICQAIIGPYHFWYLFMLVGLYAVVPFLRRFTESKRLMEYYILLFFIIELISNYGTMLPAVGSTVTDILAKCNFNFVLGYSGYYILGYYLYQYRLSKKSEIILYCSGALCMLLGIGMTLIIPDAGETYIKYLCPNIIVEAAAIYYFFVNRVSLHKFGTKTAHIISVLSKLSFGVYLIHALVLELLAMAGLNPVLITPVVMLPVIVIITYIITNCIVLIIRKIPVVGTKIT